MQKDWTQVPTQPSPESRERRLREVQTTILGADYFKDIDPKWKIQTSPPWREETSTPYSISIYVCVYAK